MADGGPGRGGAVALAGVPVEGDAVDESAGDGGDGSVGIFGGEEDDGLADQAAGAEGRDFVDEGAAAGAQLVDEVAGLGVHRGELGDVDGVDAEAAAGVFDFEAHERDGGVTHFDHEARDARAIFVEGEAQDHEGEAAVVGGAGVEPDAGFHGAAHDGEVLGDVGGISAKGHGAEGVGGEGEHEWRVGGFP